MDDTNNQMTPQASSDSPVQEAAMPDMPVTTPPTPVAPAVDPAPVMPAADPVAPAMPTDPSPAPVAPSYTPPVYTPPAAPANDLSDIKLPGEAAPETQAPADVPAAPAVDEQPQV